MLQVPIFSPYSPDSCAICVLLACQPDAGKANNQQEGSKASMSEYGKLGQRPATPVRQPPVPFGLPAGSVRHRTAARGTVQSVQLQLQAVKHTQSHKHTILAFK